MKDTENKQLNRTECVKDINMNTILIFPKTNLDLFGEFYLQQIDKTAGCHCCNLEYALMNA